MIDIGLVFGNTLKMVQERWLPMIGLWAAFFGFLIVYGFLVVAVLGASVLAMGGAMSGALSGGPSFGNAAAFGGLGIGLIIAMVIAYIGYFAILFGQQGSMAAMASPLHRINFGEAFQRGLKGGLTFLGVMVLFLLAYLVVVLVAFLIGLVLSFLGEALAIIVFILFIPAAIYIACRFSVIVPVIVVEKVYNPIKAINRTWQATGGKVLGIFLVYVIFAVAAAVVVGLPFFLLTAAIDGGAGPGVGLGILMFLFFLAIFVGFTLFSSSLVASLHAEVSDTQAVELGKTFE